jgi:hypothetical protein
VARRVAQDARLSESVMMTHYVTEREEELRHASNRTFHRILASLPQDVARRYGHLDEDDAVRLGRRLQAATDAQDWPLVMQLAAELAALQLESKGDEPDRRPGDVLPFPNLEGQSRSAKGLSAMDYEGREPGSCEIL